MRAGSPPLASSRRAVGPQTGRDPHQREVAISFEVTRHCTAGGQLLDDGLPVSCYLRTTPHAYGAEAVLGAATVLVAAIHTIIRLW
jgi:hypothetical protein